MKLVTEYLIIIDKQASEAFYLLCDSIAEFNKLLQTDDTIRINKGTQIIYNQAIKLSYEVKTDKIEGKEQRFFHLRVGFDAEEDNVEAYAAALRAIRAIIHRSGGQPETLWDDVSLYYSTKAYPQIHRVENLMRKLITYFMLTNVGKQWVKEAIPNVVMEAIDKSKRKQYLDILHQVDFIHLGDFLFKAYQNNDSAKLYETLANAQKIEELNLSDLKSFIARSNWDRYFSKIVSCTDEYLDKRWKQLYELRSMVAHNVLFGKNDFDRIVQLVSEVEPHLQKAMANLDKVYVPKEDRELVAENVASNLNSLYGDFIQIWKTLELTLWEIEASAGLADAKGASGKSVSSMLQRLHENDIIDVDYILEGHRLVNFRNRLVHDPSVATSESEVRQYLLRIEDFIKALRRSWRDEIVIALRALDGKANLSEIYEYIQTHSVRKLPMSWKSIVRYTLQQNSSDSETFKQGSEDLFLHHDKGVWGLREVI